MIIAGLGIMPVRNRYKIFIIDEVHQLSGASFNALLKSIEEPPPHVVFMMATTELDKIPETVLSRSQVYEFRTISTKAIADQLRRIVDAEGIAVGDESLQLIARDADGSMRDAQSKLDQVHRVHRQDDHAPTTWRRCSAWSAAICCSTRVQAVADEDAPAAFALAARAVEMGYDLRLVCRELSRVVRDLLVLSVDPSRISDPEIAGEGERDRLMALAARFSREDLLRAFDLLTRAEADIRGAAQPRYHLEMALLRWIHLRKLVPIEDLIAGAGAASGRRRARRASGARRAQRAAGARRRPPPPPRPAPPSPLRAAPQPRRRRSRRARPPRRRRRRAAATRGACAVGDPPAARPASDFKDALLAEIRKAKACSTTRSSRRRRRSRSPAIASTFTFSPTQRALRDMFEQNRAWLEQTAAQKSPAAGSSVDGGADVSARPMPPQRGRRRRTRRRADKKTGAARAGARRRRRAGAARGVSRGDPRRRRKCEHSTDDEAGAADAGAPAEADGRAARRRQRRRRHGHRRRQRREAGAVAQDRSRGRLEGRRRDAAGSDRRRHQRRAAQGRRGDVAEDGRHAAAGHRSCPGM